MAILAAGWAPSRWHSLRVPTRSLAIMLMSVLGMLITPVSAAEITLIHMGDLHGHLMPRPSIRGETTATDGRRSCSDVYKDQPDPRQAPQHVAAQHRGHDPGFRGSAVHQGPGDRGCAQPLFDRRLRHGQLGLGLRRRPRPGIVRGPFGKSALECGCGQRLLRRRALRRARPAVACCRPTSFARSPA